MWHIRTATFYKNSNILNMQKILNINLILLFEIVPNKLDHSSLLCYRNLQESLLHNS